MYTPDGPSLLSRKTVTHMYVSSSFAEGDNALTSIQRYDMYLDDGVSLESAPEDTYLTNSADIGQTDPARCQRLRDKSRADAEARSIFTHIKIVQVNHHNSPVSTLSTNEPYRPSSGMARDQISEKPSSSADSLSLLHGTSIHSSSVTLEILLKLCFGMSLRRSFILRIWRV